MIRGIVFTHAGLGQAFCEAVESFLGPQEDLIGLSNAQLDAESMPGALAEAAGAASDGIIIFTALYGGSCWQAAERFCRQRPDAWHLTSVNLPMLLAFASKRATVSAPALLELLRTYCGEGVRS